jgi:hypothetical protein
MRRLIVVSVVFSFFMFFNLSAFAGDINGSRLLPENKVTVYQNGVQVGVYTKEAPCPEDALLSCEGKCAIKLDSVLLMADDKSLFSISTTSDSRFLNVKKGKVYFGLSELPRKLVFLTPEGAVAAQRAFLNASSNGRGMIEGYVEVTDETSEIGLISGGSLYMQTHNEEKVLEPGNRLLILDQVDIGGAGEGAGGGGTGAGAGTGAGTGAAGGGIKLGAGALITGGLAAGAGIGYAWERHNDNGGGGKPASPSQPK